MRGTNLPGDCKRARNASHMWSVDYFSKIIECLLSIRYCSVYTVPINRLCTHLITLCVCVCACLVMSDSLWPHRLWPARLLCPWDFPGKNTREGCHFLFQGIFPTQVSNLCLLHWQVDSLPLHPLGSPVTLGTMFYEGGVTGTVLSTQHSAWHVERIRKNLLNEWTSSHG